MKEIKFRVYDKVCEEMYTVGDGCQLVVGMDGEKWSLWSDTGCIITNHDGILLQYTGLRDKNGREIYEGDIVEQELLGNVPLDFGSFIGVVKFIDGTYMIENAEGTFGVELFSETNPNEVIGNIYENLELLEVKTNNHKTV